MGYNQFMKGFIVFEKEFRYCFEGRQMLIVVFWYNDMLVSYEMGQK